MNETLATDISQFVASFPFRKELQNKHILITGATGLIGSTLIRCLLALNEQIKIVAPVRNAAKLHALFGEQCQDIQSIECDLETYDFNHISNIDYIFHCAAPTASSYFVTHPVETARSIWIITDQLLQYAHSHNISGMVYLSSLEVYGSRLDDQIITEDMQGYWDTQDVRSSYPIAKRATENLCHLYAKEFAVPIKIARLTQTTGAGISKEDNRVINQFARLATNKQDIILHSTGESARPYCYTTDCIMALFYIAIKGINGEAYNVANQQTYISALKLAEYIKVNFAPEIKVTIDIDEHMGYAPASKLNLSTSKLEALGWTPKYSLYDIIRNLIKSFQEA